jgi:hypothetical protein
MFFGVNNVSKKEKTKKTKTHKNVFLNKNKIIFFFFFRYMFCEQPLKDARSFCAECSEVGMLVNCSNRHMPRCRSPSTESCQNCSRKLCPEHNGTCYCLTRIVPTYSLPLKAYLQASLNSNGNNILIADERKTSTPDYKFIGGEGCISYSLAFLGVLGHTESNVRKQLNGHIDATWEKMKNINSKVPRQEAGSDDKRWQRHVIYLALKQKYGKCKFIFRKCATNFERNKHYLIDGMLNPKYENTNGDESEHNDFGRINENDNAWRHCVALLANPSDGDPSHFVGCAGIAGGIASIDILSLESDPRHPNLFCPNVKKGYMRKIFQVYEVFVPGMAKRPKTNSMIRRKRKRKVSFS